MAGYRNNDSCGKAARAFGPLVHPFLDCANRAEHEPEQGDNPAGVKNRGEQADVKNASRPPDDASSYRHKGERAAAHPNKKRERFAKRRRDELQRRLMSVRLDLTGVSPNEPKKPARNQSEKTESREARHQAHPCYAIEKRSSQKLAARVFRDLIEPSAISSAGTINL